MIELWIYLHDELGREQKHVWKFTPVANKELGFDIIRNAGDRATGSEINTPWAIQEIRSLTFGAGMLRIPTNKANFMRLLLAKRIVWVREINNKKVQIPFELRIDEELRWEYLRDFDSLKRKTLELAQKDPVKYTEFESYITDYLDLPK